MTYLNTEDADGLRGYAAIQIRFAEEMAARSGKPLAETLLFYTNIHRRLGLGVAGKAPPSETWSRFVDGVERLTHDQRVARAFDTLSAHVDGSAILLPGRIGFGCFACEPPDDDGMVRIHFGNRDRGLRDVGPLHHTRMQARREELTAMFGYLAREHPGVRYVNGGSWLYNIEAYRRLFPPAFADSRDPGDGPPYIHGMSSWGQFIDHRGRVRAQVRDAFYANFDTLDPERPHLTFPLQVLFTTAPFDAFRAEYGV